ncbi:7-dehydrocholesterol reductase [Sphingobacteriales bacterium UPWRP_1]|nr:7-dehydrocholesterol reductase [Sphingobacteriales bacterium TSM_CSS]PSJ72497.1 7-dehydrocholesterol reductase [Sphingobacteriales bacterium UPWRP_1]
MKLRNYLPLLIILLCPPFAMCIWYTNAELGGSLAALFSLFAQEGLLQTMVKIWKPVFFGTPAAWLIIGIFAAVQLLFIKILPGKTAYGPETIHHHVPVYKSNGLLAYLLTLALFLGGSYGLGLFKASVIYDHFGGILGALNLFSLLFCLLLYVKGRVAPSGNDHGSSGNFIFDYFWGLELYPRIAGFDVKQFTNSRFGMMSWPVIILSFAAKQHELYGISDSMLVSVLLQLAYVTIFFYYETGYFTTMDIQHDRAGFYLCWGCMVWIPSVYTSTAMYLVNYPNHLGWFWAILLLAVGGWCLYMKTNANRQRINVRAANGNYQIWGKPATYIRAKYTTAHGQEKESILLTSGWWGIASHFHYLGEIVGSLCWSLPGLFQHFMPYFYVFYLTILLAHRAFRDDARCAAKYGQYWQQYRKQVKYKVMPGIF